LPLATFTLKSPFSAPNQACGPETRALRGKSIGGQRIPSGDPAWLPQDGAGRSGARPGAPTSENPGYRRENGLPARSKKRFVPHGFYVQRPCFRAGHGRYFNRLYTYLAKSEGGQGICRGKMENPWGRENKKGGRHAPRALIIFMLVFGTRVNWMPADTEPLD